MHGDYAKACDQLDKSHEVAPEQNMYELAEKNQSLKRNLHLESVHKSQLMNEEFISWFNHFFKASTIKLFAHTSKESYLSHQAKCKLPAADIIAAADMEDFECQEKNALLDYEDLCSKTLNKKPNSKNYLLYTNPISNKVQIKEYELSKDSNQNKLIAYQTDL